MRRALLAGVTIVAQGCFLATSPFVAPRAADAPALELRAQSDSTDLRTMVSIALLHLSQGRSAEGRSLLAGLERNLPGDPAIPLLLALAEERTGDYVAAWDRYAAYADAHSGVLAGRARERRAAVESNAIRLALRRGLETAPPPVGSDRNVVAVLPFARSADDQSSRAEAAAVSTLIGWSLEGDWEVVDGSWVRVLLDELDVPGTQLAELGVGVEVGRRLGATRVIQGNTRRVSLETVEWDLTILSLESGNVARLDHLTLSGVAGQVLPMQQRAASLLHATLEDADLIEDEGLSPVFTVSVQALTSFGLGLAAMDEGEHAVARDRFAEAASLDEGFDEARAMADRMEVALGAPPADELLEEVARVGEMQRVVQAIRVAPASSTRGTMARVGRTERALVSDLLGLDVLNGNALLDLTFTLPGTAP